MAVIHALERCQPDERSMIKQVMEDRAFHGVTHSQILAIPQKYGSLEAANQRAHEYAAEARAALTGFPDSEAKRALLWAPELVILREK